MPSGRAEGGHEDGAKGPVDILFFLGGHHGLGSDRSHLCPVPWNVSHGAAIVEDSYVNF